jgi:hypothetical protein
MKRGRVAEMLLVYGSEMYAGTVISLVYVNGAAMWPPTWMSRNARSMASCRRRNPE